MELILPDWPAPSQVHACATTRLGGVSTGPYASLNLGDQVGDDPACVAENRARLRDELQLPAEPLWLTQVHGVAVAEGRGGCADASVAFAPGTVCTVMTADCLPLLLCDRAGTRVAAVHAGWRGLLAGVIEAAVARLGVPAAELLVWLGPAIGPQAFEVGDEVRTAFTAEDTAATAAFRPSPGGRWLADIYALARLRLARCGVNVVHGGGLCTFSDAARFYSYRRDGVTGRMASLIWLAV
ncbi:MAG: peptidoglycan editing factor PgeF [Thiohalomonadaceae bacterium]